MEMVYILPQTAPIQNALHHQTTKFTGACKWQGSWLGLYTAGRPGLRRPPPKNANNPSGASCDFVVDDVNNPSVFVVSTITSVTLNI